MLFANPRRDATFPSALEFRDTLDTPPLPTSDIDPLSNIYSFIDKLRDIKGVDVFVEPNALSERFKKGA